MYVECEVDFMTERSVESMAGVVIDLKEKKPIRVLHVDDEPCLLKIAKQCLEMEGHLKVDTALSVEEALMKLEKDKYDIVVSDYKMPEKDGLDFLKALRSKGNAIPFIMFTGKGREEVAIKALNLGANQYLNKVGETETVYTELAHNITELAKAKRAAEKLCVSEAARLEREKKLEAIFASSPDAITVFDLNGNVADLNEAAMKLHGFTKKEEILGKSSFEYVAPRDQSRAIELFENAMIESVRKAEFSLLTADGREFPVELYANVVKDAYGIPICLMVVTRDVSERKKAEEALRESEERFSTISSAAFEGIGISEQAKLIDANDQLAKLLGYEPGEMIGKSVLDFVAPESRDLVIAKMRAGFEGPYEHLALRKDSSVFPVEIRAKPIRYKGHMARITAISDITERKKTEEALKNSEEKYRELFENAYDAIVTLDLNGRVIDTNNAVLRYGYRKEDVVGNSILDLVPRKYHPLLMKDFSQALQGKPVKNEVEIETPNGTLIAEYCASALMREGDIVGAQVIIRGLSELKRFEKTVLESQQRFRGLFMGNPEAAAYLGPDYRILEINPRFEELFGYSLEEIRGKHINDAVVPKGKMDEAEALDREGVDGYVYHNTKRRRKDGSQVPVAVSAAPIVVEGRQAGFVAMYKDISDLKNVEKRLETMNEKLQVVGQLTRHDVRNKLTTITGNVYLLKKQLASNSEILDKLRDMETAVQEVTRIFDFAKTYETLGAEKLVYIDVGKAVDEAVALFPDLKGAKIIDECNGLTVLADSLLIQLFYNLIDNSLKYGQKITKMRIHYEQTSQGELRLIYEDDGVGIPETEKPKLFKQGYSTGGSTGYGLYLIRKMIEVYGWTIQETGTPCKGAQFTITIPKTNQTREENYRLQGA